MLKFLPQKGVMSHLYLPAELDLPPDGDTRIVGFSFPGMGALSTDNDSETVKADFLLYGITANANVTGHVIPRRRGAPIYIVAEQADFTLMLYHGHGDAQRQLFHQPVNPQNVLGTGNNPMYLGETYLIEKGDTITCEVSNASLWGGAYTAGDIYIALWGVELR